MDVLKSIVIVGVGMWCGWMLWCWLDSEEDEDDETGSWD